MISNEVNGLVAPRGLATPFWNRGPDRAETSPEEGVPQELRRDRPWVDGERLL